MGNSINFIKLHGKRLLNRYNAQYRALVFLDKEKLPNAPRHPLPPQISSNDSSIYEDFQKKDLKLDEYLKDVHVKSEGKLHEPILQNPLRPLPQPGQERKKDFFTDPDEVEKGYCTLSQITEFIAEHEENPATNSVEAIAESYSLNEKKVENILKYYSVFRLSKYRPQVEPHEPTLDEERREIERGKELYQSLVEEREKQKKETLQVEMGKENGNSESKKQTVKIT